MKELRCAAEMFRLGRTLSAAKCFLEGGKKEIALYLIEAARGYSIIAERMCGISLPINDLLNKAAEESDPEALAKAQALILEALTR